MSSTIPPFAVQSNSKWHGSYTAYSLPSTVPNGAFESQQPPLFPRHHRLHQVWESTALFSKIALHRITLGDIIGYLNPDISFAKGREVNVVSDGWQYHGTDEARLELNFGLMKLNPKNQIIIPLLVNTAEFQDMKWITKSPVEERLLPFDPISFSIAIYWLLILIGSQLRKCRTYFTRSKCFHLNLITEEYHQSRLFVHMSNKPSSTDSNIQHFSNEVLRVLLTIKTSKHSIESVLQALTAIQYRYPSLWRFHLSRDALPVNDYLYGNIQYIGWILGLRIKSSIGAWPTPRWYINVSVYVYRIQARRMDDVEYYIESLARFRLSSGSLPTLEIHFYKVKLVVKSRPVGSE